MMNNVEIPMLLLNAAISSLRETTKEWILYIYTQMVFLKKTLNRLNHVFFNSVYLNYHSVMNSNLFGFFYNTDLKAVTITLPTC